MYNSPKEFENINNNFLVVGTGSTEGIDEG